jgi:hypothetical protein
MACDCQINANMKKSQKKSVLVFIKGQVWKTGDGYIQIRDIGKRLIDYRMMKEQEQKLAKTQTTAIATLTTYLKDNAAVLMN